MNTDLKQLAEKLGIAIEFSDGGLNRRSYEADDKVVRFLAKAMGYGADTSEQIAKSLAEVDEKRWRHPLEPVYVCEQGNVVIDVVSSDLSNIEIWAVDDKGQRLSIAYEYLRNTEQHGLLYKESLRLTQLLNIGYYDLEVKLAGKVYKTRLAVAPQKCYDLAQRKIWGYALQLYALKSERNWGVGDFTDLKNFVALCARDGADIIGVNPLNTLSHDHPENASPYASISREFLNPIYIDVETVPEFLPEDKAEISGLLAELRNSELIAYTKVYPLKVKMLERCFARLQQNQNSARYHEYEAFCKREGEALNRLAAFQAIYEVETQKVWGGWRAWPAEYGTPTAGGVQSFVAEHRERVDFFKFMQFEADRQFALVHDEIKKQGLKVGLYRDLAVGVGRDSAEYWSNPERFMRDAGTGAPPDAFFPAGQKWGLGTFLPQVLKEQKYEPFIRILRANMQNAGALRMDHVMSLMRLYVIPDTLDKGTYIYYNFADMLNLVALESQLNHCVIVGESIGNVPDGFLEAIAAKNIYSLSILWAERWDSGWGDFRQPADYPENAFASVATHDIAPLRMWWFGYDIELSRNLNLLKSDAEKQEAYHKREEDRRRLLFALDKANVWPEDKPRHSDYIFGEGYPEGIEEAVERYMAKSASPVFLAQLEDFLHVEQMQNLPGTDRNQHPNWQRKVPVDLEKLSTDSAFVRCVQAIKKER
jgi:4-alpha-glucanotransferase